MPIGHYSHGQLVSIICKYIGEALGTDGCIDAADLLTSLQSSVRDLAEISDQNIQRITSSDARITTATVQHFGGLEVARDAQLEIIDGAEMEIV
jgi:hypothetical protein